METRRKRARNASHKEEEDEELEGKPARDALARILHSRDCIADGGRCGEDNRAQRTYVVV